MSKKDSVKTVDRLVSIVNSFNRERSTWSLTELSIKLGIPKSTLHRFLASLESHGILRRGHTDGLWRLGYQLVSWGNFAAESSGLRQVAKPILEDLVSETGETTILTVYNRHHVVCIEKVETTQPVRMTLEVGKTRMPHAGASSKILLAYLPDGEIQTIIHENGLPKLCNNTITNPQELRIELGKIRGQGYAQSEEETDLDAWGIAVPVYDRDSEVIASIGIAGPISRFREELLQNHVDACKLAAQRITSKLGKGN